MCVHVQWELESILVYLDIWLCLAENTKEHTGQTRPDQTTAVVAVAVAVAVDFVSQTRTFKLYIFVSACV